MSRLVDELVRRSHVECRLRPFRFHHRALRKQFIIYKQTN